MCCWSSLRFKKRPNNCYGQIRDSERSWCEQGFLHYWVHLWCSFTQLAAISQLGDDIKGLQFTCSDGCVFSGSRHNQLVLRFLFTNLGGMFEISFFWPVSLHFVPPDQCLWLHLWFLGLVFFLLVYHFDRISGELWVLFPPPPFRHWGNSFLWPLCNLCSFPTCDLSPSGFVFWVNVTWEGTVESQTQQHKIKTEEIHIKSKLTETHRRVLQPCTIGD